MDQVRTSPKTMIAAFLAAVALAVTSLLLVGGVASSSSEAGPKVKEEVPTNWRR